MSVDPPDSPIVCSRFIRLPINSIFAATNASVNEVLFLRGFTGGLVWLPYGTSTAQGGMHMLPARVDPSHCDSRDPRRKYAMVGSGDGNQVTPNVLLDDHIRRLVINCDLHIFPHRQLPFPADRGAEYDGTQPEEREYGTVWAYDPLTFSPWLNIWCNICSLLNLSQLPIAVQ